MNFASDNIVGASAPVLDAFVGPMRARSAYGNDAITEARRRALREIFERDWRGLPGDDRHGGQCARAGGRGAALGSLRLPREAHVIDDECGAPEFFMHGAKLAGLPGSAASSVAEASPRYSAGPAQSRQADAAEGAVDLAGDRMRDGLPASTRSRRSARLPGARPRLPHGRRPLRQRLVSARQHAGGDDLEAGRRHPLLRRDQERLA